MPEVDGIAALALQDFIIIKPLDAIYIIISVLGVLGGYHLVGFTLAFAAIRFNWVFHDIFGMAFFNLENLLLFSQPF
jgi:hypothetical protein